MAVTAMKPKNAVESLREIVPDILPKMEAIKANLEAMRSEMQLRDEKQTQAIKHLSEKLDYAIDIRERLAALEARLSRK